MEEKEMMEAMDTVNEEKEVVLGEDGNREEPGPAYPANPVSDDGTGKETEPETDGSDDETSAEMEEGTEGDGEGEKVDSETAQVLAFLEGRKKKYLALYQADEEIKEAQKRQKEIKKKRRGVMAGLNDKKELDAVIRRYIGIVDDTEQEQRNRARYATEAFFDILALADKTSDGSYKRIYNGFNPIREVCRAAVEAASFDGDHTIMIDTRKFLGIVKAKKAEQDNRLEEAKAKVETAWEKEIQNSPEIQSAKLALQKNADKAKHFKKKNSGENNS